MPKRTPNRVLVIGDVMLDRTITCFPQKLAAEAPAIVGRYMSMDEYPGGAANVALNAARMGAEVRLLGAIAGDTGETLNALLQSDRYATPNLSVTSCYGSGRSLTPVKTRYVTDEGKLLFRFDEEQHMQFQAGPQDFFRVARGLYEEELYDLVVISDYEKGTMHEIGGDICRYFQAKQVPVLVDARPEVLHNYFDAYALTPNYGELKMAVRAMMSLRSDEATPRDTDPGIHGRLRALSRYLVEQGPALVITTIGADGSYLYGANPGVETNGWAELIPTSPVDVFDVTGAGDTFIAALAAYWDENRITPDLVRIANAAAGVAVKHRGTYAVFDHEVEAELLDRRTADKIVPPERLHVIAGNLQKSGKRVVFTNGCFDIFHEGHRRLLQEAKDQGEHLIVALNTDQGVRRAKGEGRPYLPLSIRLRAAAALPYVDTVTWFESDTPETLIKQVRPDILVKGAQYQETKIPGADYVASRGGLVHLVPMVEHLSTTSLGESNANGEPEAT